MHRLRQCDTCNPCHICTDPQRDAKIVVVEDVADLWRWNVRQPLIALSCAVAHSHHLTVLAQTILILSLGDRVAADSTAEIIIAVNATVEGQTTAHYVTDQLMAWGKSNAPCPWCACWGSLIILMKVLSRCIACKNGF